MSQHTRMRIAAGVAAVGLAMSSAALRAQTVAPDQATEWYRLAPIVRVGLDYHLPAGTEVRDVVVVSGTVTLDGRVARDVYVWLGDLRLGPSAVVEGSVIVVAGDVIAAEGAVIRRDFAVIGGLVDAPQAFRPGHEHVLVGMPALGEGVRRVVPWIARGLLFARPIVPDLPWVWAVVGIFFLIGLAVNVFFDHAVRDAAQAVATRPFGVFLTGVLMLLVTVPILAIVAATVVGIVILPVVLCAGLVIWTIGKTGVARAFGRAMLPESDEESRLLSTRSYVLGFAAIVLAYMVPILGAITWSLVGVYGLGAATIALLAALRREYPPKPKRRDAVPVRPAPDEASVPLPTPPPAPLDAMREAEAPADDVSVAVPHAPRAAFLDRAAAFALDCLLVAIANRLLDLTWDEGMFFVLLLGYHIAFWTWQGTTLGGIITGIRVVRVNGEPLRPVDAVVRGLSSVFSFAALGIGCFWMLQDAERQTWHDKIAGTYVVKVPREFQLA
jgi:uncharacterized RDD family membrane protein YckC